MYCILTGVYYFYLRLESGNVVKWILSLDQQIREVGHDSEKLLASDQLDQRKYRQFPVISWLQSYELNVIKYKLIFRIFAGALTNCAA